MATAGPNAPGTMADDNAIGTSAWTNPDNAKVNDSSYATNSAGTGQTHYLKATGFGFAIPSGATINGIEVGIIRKAQDSSKFAFATDSVLKLVKGGTVIGNDKANTAAKWPTSDGAVTYGTPSDLWGGTWADTDINASNFGVVLSAQNLTTVTSVNFISVTVTYTAGAGGGPVKQMMHTVRMRA